VKLSVRKKSQSLKNCLNLKPKGYTVMKKLKTATVDVRKRTLKIEDLKTKPTYIGLLRNYIGNMLKRTN